MLAEKQEGGVSERKKHRGDVWVGKGCPQSGVLSPTMWCLVVDRLLRLLGETGFFTRAYVDDLIIKIIMDDQAIQQVDLMRSALSIVEKWCGEVELTVNPEKAEAELFTRKYNTKPVTGLKLFEKKIKVSKEAKNL